MTAIFFRSMYGFVISRIIVNINCNLRSQADLCHETFISVGILPIL